MTPQLGTMSCMGRSESTLQPPDPAADMSKFPVHRRLAGLRLHRAHAKSHNPWWFSSGQGRFDLSSPMGTLNLAASPEIAVREALGHILAGAVILPATVVAGRRVSSLEIPKTVFADFMAGRASAFGIIPGDVSAPRSSYSLTQKWARTIFGAGFGGIRSRSRFGGGATPCCYYLFGEAGQHELGSVVSEVKMRSVLAEMPWIVIEPTPSSESLIIDP